MKIMEYLILIGKTTFISIFLFRYSTYYMYIVHVMGNWELLGVGYIKTLAFLNTCKITIYFYKGHAEKVKGFATRFKPHFPP